MSIRKAVATLLATLVAGCAGRGAIVSAAPAPRAASAISAPVNFRVHLPGAIVAAHSRSMKYVSVNTASVAVIVTPARGPGSAPVLIGCSAGTCAGTVPASESPRPQVVLRQLRVTRRLTGR